MYNRDILGKKVNSMSFKENAYQQMSFTDSFFGLTAREKKHWKNPGQKSLPMKYSLPLMKSVFLSYTVIRHPDQILRYSRRWSIQRNRKHTACSG